MNGGASTATIQHPAEGGLSHRRRSDLQGLRAVAVLAVIAFHFGVAGVPGGFVGVDIFFVLSGFFICRLLMRDLEEHGRLNLLTFWANRAKRLLPNALLVILAVQIAAVLLLPSYRLNALFSDGYSAAAFFANFHFAARSIDYFHLDDPPSPLLHYWSLSVEEQFYLALPLLVTAVVWWRPRNPRAAMLGLLALIAVVSLAAALIVIEYSQPRAFFHPQYRAWQLAVGGVTGLLFERRAAIPENLRAACALLGTIAVAISFAFLSEDMSYPGVWALAPTLGTVALIAGVDARPFAATIGRLLTLPPMVRIGDMSYSLYLWHWPVAVFLSALYPASESLKILVGLPLTFLLAWAAYVGVERPIHRLELRRANVLRTLTAGLAGIALVVGVGFGAKALPGRSNPAITAQIAEATADLGPNYRNGCHGDYKDIEHPDCRFGRLGGPRVVLFGDSHAAQWFTPLVKAAETAGWQIDAWSKTGCPSAAVTIWYPPKRVVYEECTAWREKRLGELIANPPDLLILAHSSRYYGWIYDARQKGAADRKTAEKLWHDGFVATTNRLVKAGIPIVELRDTPQMYTSYKDCLSGGRWASCVRARGEALAGMSSPVLDETTERYSILDLSDALCTRDNCPAAIDGKIVYRDSEHLAAGYAVLLHEHFASVLKARATGSLPEGRDRN
jgi:peptidoglycan/LPS O-acetylase OafA/YrhL